METVTVYIDTKDGGRIRNGWCFEKIDHYADTGEPYKRGAWCSFRSFESFSLD